LTEENIVVRTGTPAEVHNVMALAALATEENGLFKPNKIKLLHDIWAALNLEKGIMGIIGEPGTIPEAAILLRIDEIQYGDDPCLLEKAIYVHPDFRAAKGGRAAKLCDFALSIQKEFDIPLVIGIMSNNRTAAKVKLYERKFGPAQGAYWIIGAKTGQWVGEVPPE